MTKVCPRCDTPDCPLVRSARVGVPVGYCGWAVWTDDCPTMVAAREVAEAAGEPCFGMHFPYRPERNQ